MHKCPLSSPDVPVPGREEELEERAPLWGLGVCRGLGSQEFRLTQELRRGSSVLTEAGRTRPGLGKLDYYQSQIFQRLHEPWAD